MTAEDTALKMLAGLSPAARYWPMDEERAEAARRLVAAGKLALDPEHTNEGRGVYRLNGPDPEPEKPS